MEKNETAVQEIPFRQEWDADWNEEQDEVQNRREAERGIRYSRGKWSGSDDFYPWRIFFMGLDVSSSSSPSVLACSSSDSSSDEDSSART